MKRLTTLTGKNLPRLAVAKPGWPSRCLTEQEHSLVMKSLIDSGETLYQLPEQAVADFTRVFDQTGLSEKLRKD